MMIPAQEQLNDFEFIRKNQNVVDWREISSSHNLPEDFIREFQHKLDWLYISKYQTLSEDFIKEFQNKVNWYCISSNQELSEDFIREFKDNVDWKNISYYQKLSEDFIEEFNYPDRIYWLNISNCQNLSENFIKKYKNLLEWNFIATYQILSESFIEEMKKFLNLDLVLMYQKISTEFAKKLDIKIPVLNWFHSCSSEFKLNYIKNNTNYSIVEDRYVIAYKATLKNNSSFYRPMHYKYEIGKKYYSTCDCLFIIENSLGLHAWEKERILESFNKDKNIYLVKIDIDDIGCITQENIIRAFKIEILEKVQ